MLDELRDTGSLCVDWAADVLIENHSHMTRGLLVEEQRLSSGVYGGLGDG
jgi:hypothetical protein